MYLVRLRCDVSAKGHYALVAILAYGDIFEASLISDLRMLSETSGDFVDVEHPTRVPTTSSASKLKLSLCVFIFLLRWDVGLNLQSLVSVIYCGRRI